MKIALIGYGKMGKAIEEIALSRGHEIVLKITSSNLDDLNPENLKKADVAIEFSKPQTVLSNISSCFETSVPIVVGTTGWNEKLKDVKLECEKKNGALLYASNFSIGVNLFFKINKMVAEIMGPQTDYKVSMEEIHHTQKLDSPSGTALTLATDLINVLPGKRNWVNHITDNNTEIGIQSLRIEKVPGTHSISYNSEADTIEIKHIAHSRKGFASGAVIAAEWLAGKKGVFGMQDVLGIH